MTRIATIAAQRGFGPGREVYLITYAENGEDRGRNYARSDEMPEWRADLTGAGWTLNEPHRRESTTPMPDGTLLADCSCGAAYSVPQGGNEYGALETAQAEHVENSSRTPQGGS